MLTLPRPRLLLDQFSLGGLGNCATPGSTPCCGCDTQICIVTCSSSAIPVMGALVQLFSGSTLVDSCTTPSSGCCTFTESGAYTVKVTVGGSVVHNASHTLNCSTITITVTDSLVICCGGYAIPTSLTATDAVGTFTMAYCSACSGTHPTWTGGHSVTQSSCTVTTPNNICTVAAPSSGPVRVCYTMQCLSGSSPLLTMQRQWSYVFFGGPPGTATWFQDSSGFSPGQACSTGPPGICGSPLTDTASGTANPSSGMPFMASFGTMTPAGGNATTDPIGGGVSVSA